MTTDTFALLAFVFLISSALFLAQIEIVVTIWQALKGGFELLGSMLDRHPAPRPRFDIVAARRESHALGLPFPESDGTLSLPPEPKSAVAKTKVHVLAQFGVTSEEALDAVYEALYGDRDLR